jgi:hypothetical protein
VSLHNAIAVELGCVPRLVEIQVMASGVPLMQRRWL